MGIEPTLACYFLLSIVGYGFLQALVALDTSVAVTPAPVGAVDIITVPWSSATDDVYDRARQLARLGHTAQSIIAELGKEQELKRDQARRLRHSLVYQSPEVIAAIVGWLERSLDGAPQASPRGLVR